MFFTVYRQTALVLWPSYNHAYITVSSERLKSALNNLESGAGNREDADLVQALGNSPSMNTVSALRALCSAACTWKDWDLWHRTVVNFEGDRDICSLEQKRILQAITTFGLPALQPQ